MSAGQPPTRRYAARMPPGQRREQLLDAALAIIAEQGFHAVTIEAVARRAGVSRPVVYGLFDDLPALLRALLERQEQRALAQLAEAVPEAPDDPAAALDGTLRAFLQAVAADPAGWRIVLLPPEGAPAQLRERMERNRVGVRVRIERLIAATLGPAAQDVDVELLARVLQVAAEEAGRLLLTDPERHPPERLARMADLLLAALPR